MNGVMFTYHPHRLTPDAKPIDAPPALEALQEGVGGLIEVVPGFASLEQVDGAVERAVAFCNEEGKLNKLPYNSVATTLWDKALRRAGGQGLWRDDRPADVLVGPVVVIIGDDELLEAL